MFRASQRSRSLCDQDGLRVIENLEVNTFLPYFVTDTTKLSLSSYFFSTHD